MNWNDQHLGTISKVQEIFWNKRQVGADTYHEINGIHRILRITKDLGDGKWEAILSPRSYQYPAFVGKTWVI